MYFLSTTDIVILLHERICDTVIFPALPKLHSLNNLFLHISSACPARGQTPGKQYPVEM